MLENKDYCDYDTCVTLKKLGFNSLVDWYFKEDKSIASSFARYRKTYIPRISLYEAQKWLREEKDILVYPEKNSFGWYYAIHYNVGKVQQFKYSEEYDSYEDALLEGIKEAVKMLKENDNKD